MQSITADRAQSRIFAAFDEIAHTPSIGHHRPDLIPRPFRFFKVYSYLVIYNPAAEPLQIHAVLHGARDIAEVLKERTF